MGWYVCPRCGGKDTYEGSELVSHREQGSSYTVTNEYGVGMTREIGGGASTEQVTVAKCRGCGEQLGKKDFHYSEEELAAMRKAAMTKKILILLLFAVVGAVGVLIYVVNYM
jgi:hypothetical protein